MNVTLQLLKLLWMRNDGFRKIRSIRTICRLRRKLRERAVTSQEEMLPPVRV